MIYFYPYIGGSRSVTALKEALGARIIKLENSRYRNKTGNVVINWGNSRVPSWYDGSPILNSPSVVARAANKLLTFQHLHNDGVSTVSFTTDKDEAEDWMRTGGTVFVRSVLDGHSGEGIQVVRPTPVNNELDSIASRLYELGFEFLSEQVMNEQVEQTLPQAPLYTHAVQNDGEYRVHVFDGQVILYQKKSRRREEDGSVDTPDDNESLVRNLASGWVYRTSNLNRLERVEQLALDAVDSLGLDFGAVDIIKDTEGNVFVLEVNTAPGLGNTETIEAYRSAIVRLTE